MPAANLILHYNRSATAAQQTADEASQGGVHVALRQADLADSQAMARLFLDAAGPVHIRLDGGAHLQYGA